MKGPLLIMAGIALFGLLDANTKLLSGEFSPAQALVFRHGVLLVLLALRVRAFARRLRLA